MFTRTEQKEEQKADTRGIKKHTHTYLYKKKTIMKPSLSYKYILYTYYLTYDTFVPYHLTDSWDQDAVVYGTLRTKILNYFFKILELYYTEIESWNNVLNTYKANSKLRFTWITATATEI